MQPKLIPAYDGIASADHPSGSVVALDNGTLAFFPVADLYGALYRGDLRTASTMLDVALAPRGLTWATVQYANWQRQGFVSRLARDAQRQPVPRTPEQVRQLAEVAAALEAGSLEPLLTPEALKVREDARVRVAAKEQRDAKFARAHWPQDALGIVSTLRGELFVLKSPRDEALIKAFKASGGRWSPAERVWLVPQSEEISLGRRLAKIVKARTDPNRAPASADLYAAMLAKDREAPLSFGAVAVAPHRDGWHVRFEYDPELVAALKKVPGARFERETREWVVPLAERDSLATRLGKHRERVAEREASERLAVAAALAAEEREPLRGSEHVRLRFTGAGWAVQLDHAGENLALLREIGASFDRSRLEWFVPAAQREALQAHLPRMLELTAQGVAERERAAQGRVQRLAADFEAGRPAHRYVFSDRAGSDLPAVGGFMNDADAGKPPVWVKVLERSAGRYIEDASSLGGDMGREYQFRLTVRRASEQELAQIAERQARAQRMREDWKTLQGIVASLARKPEGRCAPDLHWYEATDEYAARAHQARSRVKNGLRLFDAPGPSNTHFLHLAEDGRSVSEYRENTYDTVWGALVTRALTEREVATLLELAAKYPRWRLDSAELQCAGVDALAALELGVSGGGSDAQAVAAFRERLATRREPAREKESPGR